MPTPLSQGIAISAYTKPTLLSQEVAIAGSTPVSQGVITSQSVAYTGPTLLSQSYYWILSTIPECS